MRRIVAWSLVATLSLAACTATGSSQPSAGVSTPPDTAAPREGAADEGADEITADEIAADEIAAAVAEREDPVRLVTLGDAYTHGTETSAPRRDSWPAQLAESLSRNDVRIWLRNLAEQGQTSGRLLEDQIGQVGSLEPDVVTLQVGVNDIIAREVDGYRENVASAFDELLLILPAGRIFAITTPDHTLTEWGDAYGPRESGRAAVAELNATLAEEAAARGIGVIDISEVSELVTGDPSLVVGDGPYPSAKQYAGWVEVIGPHIHDALAVAEP